MPEHYHQEDFDVRYAHHLIDAVPDDAYVCAASMFVPRLAMRDNVEDFLFKRKKDPDHPEK